MKGGAEAIVHAARKVVDDSGDKFLLQADLINAFNQADRGAALQEVAEHFPELLPWVITSYSTPSFLKFGSADISSETGFHQGDPLAALLFALVLHPILLIIQEEIPSLSLNSWFLDDGTSIGTAAEVGQVVDILLREGPARGLFLSTRNTVRAPAKPKTTAWSRLGGADVQGVLNERGVLLLQDPGIILLGAPIGSVEFVKEALQTKKEKIAEISALLPHLQDPHTEFALLRSCLSLPKLMFSLRTVSTTEHLDTLREFDQVTREGLTRILGTPIPDQQWDQAKLPVAMGGLGLRTAEDHAAAAFSTSFLSSRWLLRKMLNCSEDDDPLNLPLSVLDAITTNLKEEQQVVEESLIGYTQKQLSTKVDLANSELLTTAMETSGEREMARLGSLGLPYAGAWLNCPPMPALGLHLRGVEFAAAVKFRLGLPIYNSAGPCPACDHPSDVMGDHALVCGFGGERIARHNLLRDALHQTAAAAGLAPTKEGRALIPGNNMRPADVFIPHWSGGRDAALDVTVTHPLQDRTRAGAAVTPGYAMDAAYARKVAGAGEQCRQQGIAFIPIVAESLGGWHPIAVEQIKKLGSALARHTGQEEGEAISHLVTRCSILLQRGLTAFLLNRVPGYPAPEINGVE